MKKTKKKTVKAWAIVNEYGLTWSGIDPANSKYGSALHNPNISTNRRAINKDLEEGESVVPCTITYSV